MSLKAHIKKRVETYAPTLANRVFGVRAKTAQATPYVVMFEKTTTRQPFLRGTAASITTRMQLDCVGSTADQAKQVSEQVIEALNDYTGHHAGNTITECRITDDLDDNWSDDVGLFRRIVDLKVTHKT